MNSEVGKQKQEKIEGEKISAEKVAGEINKLIRENKIEDFKRELGQTESSEVFSQFEREDQLMIAAVYFLPDEYKKTTIANKEASKFHFYYQILAIVEHLIENKKLPGVKKIL